MKQGFDWRVVKVVSTYADLISKAIQDGQYGYGPTEAERLLLQASVQYLNRAVRAMTMAMPEPVVIDVVST